MMKRTKEVDCSDIHLKGIDIEDRRFIKNYINEWGGYYEFEKRYIWINATFIKYGIKTMARIVNHEAIHKILHETEGKKAGIKIDNLINNIYDLTSDGIGIKYKRYKRLKND